MPRFQDSRSAKKSGLIVPRKAADLLRMLLPRWAELPIPPLEAGSSPLESALTKEIRPGITENRVGSPRIKRRPRSAEANNVALAHFVECRGPPKPNSEVATRVV